MLFTLKNRQYKTVNFEKGQANNVSLHCPSLPPGGISKSWLRDEDASGVWWSPRFGDASVAWWSPRVKKLKLGNIEAKKVNSSKERIIEKGELHKAILLEIQREALLNFSWLWNLKNSNGNIPTLNTEGKKMLKKEKNQ